MPLKIAPKTPAGLLLSHELPVPQDLEARAQEHELQEAHALHLAP